MYRSQISSKGQVVIPAGLREELKLKPGTPIVFERDGHAIIMRPVTVEFIRSLRGVSKTASDIREREHQHDRY